MEAKKMPRDCSAQMNLLREIIRDIKEWRPNVSFDDGDAQYAFGLTVDTWVIQLRTLADSILSKDIVTCVNAIDVDVHDFVSAVSARSKLESLVPIIEDELVSISRGDVPPPNSDLPDDITRDYEEAGTIVEFSPRGAAALLRLCIQNLCIHLGEPGKDLNKDIGAMVAKGLDESVQKALDTVRVLGNEAVHPGTLDLRDDRQTVKKMFVLVNMIAQEMITLPREREDLFKMLPEDKRQGIYDRDKKAKAAPSRPR